MSSRITSAIASRNARENLVKLLFGDRVDSVVGGSVVGSVVSSIASQSVSLHEVDRHNHKGRRRRNSGGAATAADNAANSMKRHSYTQLRTAYIQKVHEMHPDKIQSNANKNEAISKEDAHVQFIAIKNAWEEYHASVIIQKKKDFDRNNTQSPDNDYDYYWEEDADFTMFGVGCSFADSQSERDLRNEIMDQACRGWFSSGSISHIEALDSGGIYDNVTKQHSTKHIAKTQLSDDNMFIPDNQSAKENDDTSKRKSLVETVDLLRKKR